MTHLANQTHGDGTEPAYTDEWCQSRRPIRMSKIMQSISFSPSCPKKGPDTCLGFKGRARHKCSESSLSIGQREKEKNSLIKIGGKRKTSRITRSRSRLWPGAGYASQRKQVKGPVFVDTTAFEDSRRALHSSSEGAIGPQRATSEVHSLRAGPVTFRQIAMIPALGEPQRLEISLTASLE